ncbi:MAG: hypothetical protein WCK34_14225 [Bacteroidota bacterium]
MAFKRNFIWFLLFGTLIGLNETVIGGLKIPCHSVVLSSITLLLLAIGRFRFPVKGSTLVITAIALLFKMNSMGIRECTAPALLCGPTALAMIGITFEIFATLFIGRKQFAYPGYLITCALTSLIVFGLFAVLQTFILQIWDTARCANYILVRGPFTAAASAALASIALILAQSSAIYNIHRLNPYLKNSLLFTLIMALWIFGYFAG